MRANDLDAITAFQSAITVQEQGKQTGVIQISLEDKNPEHAALVANALAQSYVRQHVASKQADAIRMLDVPEERRAAPEGRSRTRRSRVDRVSASVRLDQCERRGQGVPRRQRAVRAADRRLASADGAVDRALRRRPSDAGRRASADGRVAGATRQIRGPLPRFAGYRSEGRAVATRREGRRRHLRAAAESRAGVVGAEGRHGRQRAYRRRRAASGRAGQAEEDADPVGGGDSRADRRHRFRVPAPQYVQGYRRSGSYRARVPSAGVRSRAAKRGTGAARKRLRARRRTSAFGARECAAEGRHDRKSAQPAHLDAVHDDGRAQLASSC